MNGLRFSLSRWGARRWAVTAAAALAFCAAVLSAGQGLASGAAGDVLGVRFGGDAQRTRVVVDLDKTTRGQVIADGAAGRVAVSLASLGVGRGLSGTGSGLVQSWRMDGRNGAARLELELSRTAEIERRFLLPPADGVAHYRYVIDIKSSGAPAPEVRTPRRDAPVQAGRRRAEKPLIVIDAGHGGNDPGASGQILQEKTVTLAAAQQLKAELERTGRYRVRLTRDGDRYVALNRRVEMARAADADLFISLHADAGPDGAVRGASVYTLSEQGAGRAVREYTRGDNWHQSLRLPGRDPSVDRILLDMTQRATQNRSAQFARVLLTHLEAAEHPMLRRSHRDAGLAVLLAPDVPAVLLEMGFITNPEDERLLADARARGRLMRAVAEAIDRYFQEPSAPLQIAGGDGAGRP